MLYSININDSRNSSEDGEDILKNVEYIKFADQLVEASKVNISKSLCVEEASSMISVVEDIGCSLINRRSS